MRLLSARTALDGRLPSPIASGNNSRSSQGAQPGRWRNAGQASQTLAQHSANAGPMLGSVRHRGESNCNYSPRIHTRPPNIYGRFGVRALFMRGHQGLRRRGGAGSVDPTKDGLSTKLSFCRYPKTNGQVFQNSFRISIFHTKLSFATNEWTSFPKQLQNFNIPHEVIIFRLNITGKVLGHACQMMGQRRRQHNLVAWSSLRGLLC